MIAPLLALLLVATPEEATTLRAEGAPGVPVQPLSGAEDVGRLCKRLVPAERLRIKGDAVDQGEARARQERVRDEAITGRYQLTVPAAKLAFAPYDGPEQTLQVAAPATLRLGGTAVVTATEDRGLPVRLGSAMARRVLATQAAGRLWLRLVFDLPDDAICAVDRGGRRVNLGVEPVEWTWLDGDAPLAWGGVAADRPAVSLAAGARPVVEVGEPIAGPSEARRAVFARSAELAACYADGLQRAPALDGVLVVDLGPRVAVSADSTGSPDLARCVEKALAPLVGTASASVPIRFELALPGAGAPAEAVAPAGEGSSAAAGAR